MNDKQIKNGEVRIFPYYKGEYWGKSEVEFGFSNKNSALKYMKPIPKEDIYDSMGGYEKYYNENAYLLPIDENRQYVFNPRSRFDTRREEGCYDYQYNGKHYYIKDLPNREDIEKDLKELGFIPDASRNKFREFERKYQLFPHIYLEERPYNTAKKKFIQNNIEFREGIVRISVDFIDKN